jgi:hypothetical protein
MAAPRPNTDYIGVIGHLREILTAQQLAEMGQPTPATTQVKDAVVCGYLKERIFRLRHGSTRDGQPCTEMGFWTGGYRGKGRLKSEGVLFCNRECATYFAVAAYRDGMRIKRDGHDAV